MVHNIPNMNQHLGAAILKRDTFAIEGFLKAGADPNAIIPGEEFAPIHLGAGTSKSVTQLLLRYGADPNAQTYEGSTPLHIAASWGKSDVLKLLLKYGADISIRDNEKLDALGIAGKYKYKNCVRILQDHERKNEIDIKSKTHSSTYNQIEINVYLNDRKIFSTFIDRSFKMLQNVPDQFIEDGLITEETYKTDENEYNCELKQSDDNILTLSINSDLISLPMRKEFSTIGSHEQVPENKNYDQSDDQCLDAKIKQGSSTQNNTNTKIEETFITYKQQNSDHNDLKSRFDPCLDEAIKKPLTETVFHRSKCNKYTLMHDSDYSFDTRRHKTSANGFNDVLCYATQDEHQYLNIEVDPGSRQSLTLPHTGYHFDQESEIDPDETDQIDCQVSNEEINKVSIDYEQSNDHSEYQKMVKLNDENRNFETKIPQSLTKNSPRVPCSSTNYLAINTNPDYISGRRTCVRYQNKEFCIESDENIYPSQPCETLSDYPYPDSTPLKSKYKCNYVDEQTDSNDEIHFQFFHPYTKTSEEAVKQNRFKRYSNNLYLKFAACVNRRKGKREIFFYY